MTAEEAQKFAHEFMDDLKHEKFDHYEAKSIITSIIIAVFNKGKQQAEMGFAEWCNVNQWIYYPSISEWIHYYHSTVPNKTTSELYQIWLESNKPTQ